MKRLMLLMFLILSTAAIGQDSKPRRTKKGSNNPVTIHESMNRRGGARGTTVVSVPEPQTLALLATGLVSLGIYAKQKKRKKV